MISKRFINALSRRAAAFFAAAVLASGLFILKAHAYDYSKISGSDATGADISGYESALAVNVEDFGADPSGNKNSAAALQKALDYAGDHSSDKVQVKVIVPEGTYSVGKCLWIHSNTWLYLDNATLRKDFSGGCLIMNYRDDLSGGFDGSHNIIIEGGCLDGNTYGGNVKAFSTIRMGHLHDLWVKDVEFKDNYNCHLLELGGIKNVTIEGCSFHEYYGPKYKEAIQFDILNNDGLFDGYPPFDDTPCDNVVIKNNNFYDLMRGLGSHSATVGEYYTNFLITGNTFNNIYDDAIIMENYRKCTIENNTMTNVGCGIDFVNMTNLETSGYNDPVAGYDGIYDRINDFSDTIIKGNTISAIITEDSERPYGIYVFGKLVQNSSLPDHDYVVEGMIIEGNNITTSGNAIQTVDATGVLIKSNMIGTPGEGDFYENNLINVKYCKDVHVEDNDLTGSYYHSITVTGGTGGIVSGNTCKNSTACGIVAEKNAALSITENTVENSGKSSIGIKDGSTAEVSDNTISGTAASGVKLEKTEKILISGNTISGCKVAAINAAEESSAFVDSNTLTDNTGENYKGAVYATPVTDFTADGVYGDHVQLSWLSRGCEDGYSVKRKSADQSEFEEIAVVNTPSYIDEGLPSNTKYQYRIDSLLNTGSKMSENSSEIITVRTKAPMSECTCDLDPVYRYSGKKIEPDFNVYMDGFRLRRDVDYKVKMYNNIAAGTATVVVSGCGEYSGFSEFKFDIKFSEGTTDTAGRPDSTMLTGITGEKYEVIAVPSLTGVLNDSVPDGNVCENTDIVGAINNAKNTDGVRIYSRKKNSLNSPAACGLWF